MLVENQSQHQKSSPSRRKSDTRKTFACSCSWNCSSIWRSFLLTRNYFRSEAEAKGLKQRREAASAVMKLHGFCSCKGNVCKLDQHYLKYAELHLYEVQKELQKTQQPLEEARSKLAQYQVRDQ